MQYNYIMNLICSLVFGSEGSYRILEAQVTFQDAQGYGSPNDLNCVTRCFKSLFLNNRVVCCLVGSYAHVFFREMGHVLAHRLLTCKGAVVSIDRNPCEASTGYVGGQPRGWKGTLINVAGPMAGVAFEIGKLALGSYLMSTCPLVGIILIAGSVIWISAEFISSIISLNEHDNGSFDLIADQGWAHLAFASCAFITEIALGIILVI